MKKHLLTILLATLLSSLFIVSCEKEEVVVDEDVQFLLDEIETLTVEEYTADLAEFDLMFETDENLREFAGDRPCFKFIFPIKFIVPNQDAPVVVNSQKELREFFKKWKNSPSVSDVKPQIVFPFEVKLRNGRVLTINSQAEFKKLKKRCADQKPDIPKFRLCFNPVFPIWVAIPTQNAPVEVNSVKELHELFVKWKTNHPDAASGPAIIFPIKIKTLNGKIIKVNSMEELKKYLRKCLRKFGDDNTLGG